MTDKTPSQQAKEYARANGFHIEPEGRRYCITRSMSPECLSVVATVGGYPAALNAMQRWIDERTADPMLPQLDPNETADVVRDDEPAWLTKTAAMIQGDIVVGLESLRNMSNDIRTIRMGRGVELDAIGKKMGLRVREPAETDESYRNLLLYGTSDPFGFVAPLEPIHVATGAYLDKWAKIRKPPGGPWHVIFNGDTVMKYGYPTRAEALVVVRRGFNHSDPQIRNNWRTGTITTEFRAS